MPCPQPLRLRVVLVRRRSASSQAAAAPLASECQGALSAGVRTSSWRSRHSSRSLASYKVRAKVIMARTILTSMRLNPELKAALDRAAKKDGRSVSLESEGFIKRRMEGGAA